MAQRVRMVARKPGGLRYRTRMLAAGEEFEAESLSDARILRSTKWAEDAPEPSHPSARRGSRTQATAQEGGGEAASAADDGDDLGDSTRDELLEMAAERGLEIPTDRYVRKDELIALLRDHDGGA